jgi:hypothetical protein
LEKVEKKVNKKESYHSDANRVQTLIDTLGVQIKDKHGCAASD